MIRAIIESMLGEAGVKLLHFYEANSLWLNALIFLYGLWILLSWANYKAIRSDVLQSVMQQMSSLSTLPNQAQLSTQLLIPWQDVLNSHKFPFVAQQTDLLPKKSSIETLRAMLPIDTLVKDAQKCMTDQKKK